MAGLGAVHPDRVGLRRHGFKGAGVQLAHGGGQFGAEQQRDVRLGGFRARLWVGQGVQSALEHRHAVGGIGMLAGALIGFAQQLHALGHFKR
ncbi:hypothetical protein D3C71_1774230 [compost metagenome]